MENLKDLINYLSPDRINTEQGNHKHFMLVDENYDYKATPPYNEESKRSNSYFSTNMIRLTIKAEDNGATLLYLNDSDPDNWYYYIRRTVLDGGVEVNEYKEIGPFSYDVWSTMPEEDLTQVVLYNTFNIYFDYNSKKVYVDVSLYVHNTTISFPYSPSHLSGLVDGQTYLLDYIDHDGDSNSTFDQSWKTISANETIGDEIGDLIEAKKRRAVRVNFSTEEGQVYWYPKIGYNNALTKFQLVYNYATWGSKIGDSFQYLLQDKPKPIKITFISLHTFMSFVNQVHFKERDYFFKESDTKNDRYEFVQSYFQLIREAYTTYGSNLGGVYTLTHYVPDKLLLQFDDDYKWEFIERAVEQPVTNWGINKDDIMAKILNSLAFNIEPQRFLDQLMDRRVQGVPLLYWVKDRLNGSNYQSFISIIWQAWKQTPYAEIDPSKNKWLDETGKNPILLYYTSDKFLSFHLRNASVNWTNPYEEIKVDINLNESVDFGEQVGQDASDFVKDAPFQDAPLVKDNSDPNERRDRIKDEVNLILDEHLGDLKIDSINTEHYTYHPYAPIAIVNEDNKEFIFRDSSQFGGPYTFLPAFVLKADADSAFWEDIVTLGEYFIDVVTTFSGFLNILKAGRLFRILRAGKTLRYTSPFATKTKAIFRASSGVFEITAGIGNGLLKITGVRDTPLGRAISEFLFFMELFALAIDMTTFLRDSIKKSSLKILDNSDDFGKRLGQISNEAATSGNRVPLQEVTAAAVHLLQISGKIVALNLKKIHQFTNDLAQTLEDLGVKIWRVTDGKHLNDFFNHLNYEFAFVKSQDYVVMRNGELIQNGPSRWFDSFADDLGDSIRKGGKSGGDDFLKNKTRTKVYLKEPTVSGSKSVGGAAVKLLVVDKYNNPIGHIIRTSEKSRKLVYKFIFIDSVRKEELFCDIQLLNTKDGLFRGIPIDEGEELLYADFAIPKSITNRYSGLGKIMLDDGHNYFKTHKKFGKVTGVLDLYVRDAQLYAEYGGESILLKQFWDSVNSGKSYEEAAFSTFSGKWAKENGFTKFSVKDPIEDITKDKVLIQFLKK